MGKFKFIILLITLYSLNLTGETEVKVGIKYSEPWVMYDKMYLRRVENLKVLV